MSIWVLYRILNEEDYCSQFDTIGVFNNRDQAIELYDIYQNRTKSDELYDYHLEKVELNKLPDNLIKCHVCYKMIKINKNPNDSDEEYKIIYYCLDCYDKMN
jgi:hypothetical protein